MRLAPDAPGLNDASRYVVRGCSEGLVGDEQANEEHQAPKRESRIVIRICNAGLPLHSSGQRTSMVAIWVSVLLLRHLSSAYRDGIA